MPFLMHIAFSNAVRLDQRIYYFSYAGVRFKPIQNNPRKHSDVLLTLIERYDEASSQKAYAAGGEFLGALAWQHRIPIAIANAGGMGLPPSQTLRRSRCRVWLFPLLPFSGDHSGYGLSVIPHIETSEQRLALTLYREATSSNKRWLSFLFFWQILEVGGNDPVGWINSVYYKRKQVHVSEHELSELKLGGQRLGEYLQDNGRHGIAHIRRRAGSPRLQFDVSSENRRMSVSTDVVRQFAEHYIKDTLLLHKKLHLVRKRGRGFPTFVDERTLRRRHWVMAYR